MVELNVLEERLRAHASDLTEMKTDFKAFRDLVLKTQEAHKVSIIKMETKIPIYIAIVTTIFTVAIGVLEKYVL